MRQTRGIFDRSAVFNRRTSPLMHLHPNQTPPPENNSLRYAVPYHRKHFDSISYGNEITHKMALVILKQFRTDILRPYQQCQMLRAAHKLITVCSRYCGSRVVRSMDDPARP